MEGQARAVGILKESWYIYERKKKGKTFAREGLEFTWIFCFLLKGQLHSSVKESGKTENERKVTEEWKSQ